MKGVLLPEFSLSIPPDWPWCLFNLVWNVPVACLVSDTGLLEEYPVSIPHIIGSTQHMDHNRALFWNSHVVTFNYDFTWLNKGAQPVTLLSCIPEWPILMSAATPIALGQSMHMPGYYTYFTWHTPLLPSTSYLIRCSLSNCPTWHRRSYWQRRLATRTKILTIQRKSSFGAISYGPRNGPQSPCIVLIWNNALWFSSLQSCRATYGLYVKSTHVGYTSRLCPALSLYLSVSLSLCLTHTHTHTNTHSRLHGPTSCL